MQAPGLSRYPELNRSAARSKPTVGCRPQAPQKEQTSEGRPRLRTHCQAWCWRSHPSWRTPKSPLARDLATWSTRPECEPSGTRTLSSGSHLDTCVSLTCSLSRPGREPRSPPSSQSGLGDRRALPRRTKQAAGGAESQGARSRVGVPAAASAVPGRGSPPSRSPRRAAERLRQGASSGRRRAPGSGCCSETLGRPLPEPPANRAPPLLPRSTPRLQSPFLIKKHHLRSVLYALFQRILPVRLGNVFSYSHDIQEEAED